MSYQLALDLLRDMIKENEKKPPFVLGATLYYVIKSARDIKNLTNELDVYMNTPTSDPLEGELLGSHTCLMMGMSLIFKRGDLPKELEFLLNELFLVSGDLHDLAASLHEKKSNYKKMKELYAYMAKNLEEVYDKMASLGFTLEPKGSGFDPEIISWWDDYKISKV